MVSQLSPDFDAELSHSEMLARLSLMRRAFESLVNGVSIADATIDDLPLIYVNPAFEKMTGYSSDEVLGRNCRFLQRGETPPEELALLRRAIRHGEEVRVVLKNYTKDGAVFWNELYLSPVFDADGGLTHYVGIQNDITSRVELRQQLEHMALHDGLTGLANRALMMDRMREALSQAKRYRRMVALLFFDLDGFKDINDRYGHEAGDLLLKIVAAMLKRTLRDSDCAARLGGDEFVLLITNLLSEEEVWLIHNRLLLTLELPVMLDGHEIVSRASMGLSFYPADGDTAEQLLKSADQAMYRDKELRRESKSREGDGSLTHRSEADRYGPTGIATLAG